MAPYLFAMFLGDFSPIYFHYGVILETGKIGNSSTSESRHSPDDYGYMKGGK